MKSQESKLKDKIEEVVGLNLSITKVNSKLENQIENEINKLRYLLENKQADK